MAKLMSVNPLEAHDRYQYLTQQDFSIEECCQNLINQRPFGDVPFYIFAHTRTEPDGATKRLIWQPRLTKPKAEPNSMLFKTTPGSDIVKVIWMIPAKELWNQFERGLLTENQLVKESIINFRYHRDMLEAREDDDLTDPEIDAIYREISRLRQKI